MRKTFAALLLAFVVPVAAQAPRIEAEAGVAQLLRLARAGFARADAGPGSAGVVENSASGALAKLCREQVGVAGTARAATAQERQACAQEKLELIELPVGLESVAVIVNPANTWARRLRFADLRRIWLEDAGKAASWRDLEPGYPAFPLKLYGPAPRLGLAASARAALNAGAAQPGPELRADVSASEILAVVVEGVARDRWALGLLDRATYLEHANRVKLLPVDGALAFPVYVYTSQRALGDAGTRAYLDYLLANGAQLAPKAGLAALSPGSYEQARQRLGARQ
jgi:phosphate transport system substrate-binding protein